MDSLLKNCGAMRINMLRPGSLLFLVEFYEMHLRIGRPETTLHLPFSREEIASYLDLKIETVSRSFKSLEQQNLITLHRVRTVTLNSYLGLKGFS
jgi:CRP/FNR family transcriptional regulator